MSLRTNCFLLFIAVACHYPAYTEGTPAKILWRPLNLTVPGDQYSGSEATASFNCGGQGTLLLWYINDELVVSHRQPSFEQRDFIFTQEVHNNGTIVNTLTIPARVENNNTRLRCHATGNPGPARSSETCYLIIAGPPLTPQPVFHVVNATHIKVQWDKPFALPEYDVRNYTLLIGNTSSSTHVFQNQILYNASEDTEYPIRHYINNGGIIPDDCVYLNFTLTASSDAGTSNAGFATGGFAIAPSPINDQMLHYEVTFSTDITPMLHINFTFPEVCDYHEAIYAVTILDRDRIKTHQTNDMPYTGDGPLNVEVEVRDGMEMNKIYTGVINVTTAVKSTTTEFVFGTSLMPIGTLIPIGSLKSSINTPDHEDIIIPVSAVAGGLFIILLIVIVFLLTGFILRRRKLKRRTRAYQHEVDTGEAVQRATLAMIPNPIYSGNPIYDEIADPKLLKFLRSRDSEPQSRDEGYVEISSPGTNMVGAALQPNLESKLVSDKCTTLPEDTYTVMNPAGTLSNQVRSPTCTENGHSSLAMKYNGGIETLSSDHLSGSATQSSGYITGLGSSTSSSMFPTTRDPNEVEERYVKGAF